MDVVASTTRSEVAELPEWLPPTSDALELSLFRNFPDWMINLESLRVGDVDGDGSAEIVAGGDGALVWYRAIDGAWGVIARGHFGVSIALEDLDGDGVPEVVTARERNERDGVWSISAFRLVGGAWQEYTLVPAADGEAHDLAFADLDGDGERELVANSPYSEPAGTLAYKRGADGLWQRHELVMGISSEGIEVVDLDGDGRLEIVHGSDWYAPPPDGPFSGPWEVRSFAPSFREMGRVAIIDVTGNGAPDIVLCEAEYPDGRLSWFENRLLDDREAPWREHQLDIGLYYAHSLSVWREDPSEVRIFAGEMHEGGYLAPRNWHARLIEYRVTAGRCSRRELTRSAGTHEAIVADVDDDGVLEIVGKDWREPAIQIWRPRAGPARGSIFEHRLIDRDKHQAAHAIVALDVRGAGAADVFCGSRWYRAPAWDSAEVAPGVEAAAGADLDADGSDELVVLRTVGGQTELAACSLRGEGWSIEPIGELAEEPLRVAASPLGSGRPALVAASCPSSVVVFSRGESTGSWQREDVKIAGSGALTIADLEGRGALEVVLGTTYLKLGANGYERVDTVEGPDLRALAVEVADVDGDGRKEIVVGLASPQRVIHGDHDDHYRQLGRLVVLGRSADGGSWQMRHIDSLRHPSALVTVDVDGDGRAEIVCGEHDSSWPYRAECRLMLYTAPAPGSAWLRSTIETRFETVGLGVARDARGGVLICGHGSSDVRYVHLWSTAPGGRP